MSSKTQQSTINDYLDKHRDDIKYAKKGYIKTITDGLKNECSLTLTEPQVRRAIASYRSTHNCPIEYVPNKYYKPSTTNGKRSYTTQSTPTEEPTPEEPAPIQLPTPPPSLIVAPPSTPATAEGSKEDLHTDLIAAILTLSQSIEENFDSLIEILKCIEDEVCFQSTHMRSLCEVIDRLNVN